MTVTTYCGDCLVEMDNIPDHSVNMILCDLPYGTTKNSWDAVIPFDSLWEQYKRILIEGGVVALFAQHPFNFTLGCSNLPWFRYQWIWRKNVVTGFLNANRAPLKSHEDILIFCEKGAPYNPQVSQRAPAKSPGMGSRSSNYGGYHTMPDELTGVRYPQDVLDFKVESKDKLHPTQKPVPLCEYLIRTYTDEGMTVLDNCMGSGTTGVAAVQTGRDFIGIERDPEYYRIAVERINAAKRKTSGRVTLEAFA
ncbi:MAG: site-specific DNA-methyltransferase [Candidatus Methanomethylophilaceae archaeon]|nr:site-specific DNA-methyltransferase [Candidatus Methanomethylophilaceae archaeon]